MSHTYTYTHTQTDFLVSPKYSFSSKGSFLLMSIFRKSEKKKLNEWLPTLYFDSSVKYLHKNLILTCLPA